MYGMTKLQKMIAPTLFAGIVAAVLSSWQSGAWEKQARAEPRRVTPQEPDQHFKSGGRLSEAVLQEMLAVLKRIDERLERMEKSVEQAANNRGSAVFRTDAEGTQPTSGTAPIQVRRGR
jgi:hypothetical protein